MRNGENNVDWESRMSAEHEEKICLMHRCTKISVVRLLDKWQERGPAAYLDRAMHVQHAVHGEVYAFW